MLSIYNYYLSEGNIGSGIFNAVKTSLPVALMVGGGL